MLKKLTVLGFIAILPTGTSLASDDCLVPMTDWQPRDAVVQLAAAKDWTVRRIKIDDGCYQIDGSDPDGRRIEVTIHPATLAVLELEYKGDHDEHGLGAEGRNDD